MPCRCSILCLLPLIRSHSYALRLCFSCSLSCCAAAWRRLPWSWRASRAPPPPPSASWHPSSSRAPSPTRSAGELSGLRPGCPPCACHAVRRPCCMADCVDACPPPSDQRHQRPVPQLPNLTDSLLQPILLPSRRPQQIQYPAFPTTTIGSFPQVGARGCLQGLQASRCPGPAALGRCMQCSSTLRQLWVQPCMPPGGSGCQLHCPHGCASSCRPPPSAARAWLSRRAASGGGGRGAGGA